MAARHPCLIMCNVALHIQQLMKIKQCQGEDLGSIPCISYNSIMPKGERNEREYV